MRMILQDLEGGTEVNPYILLIDMLFIYKRLMHLHFLAFVLIYEKRTLTERQCTNGLEVFNWNYGHFLSMDIF